LTDQTDTHFPESFDCFHGKMSAYFWQ